MKRYRQSDSKKYPNPTEDKYQYPESMPLKAMMTQKPRLIQNLRKPTKTNIRGYAEKAMMTQKPASILNLQKTKKTSIRGLCH